MAKYELGNMDRYQAAVNGTVMENSPYFTAVLKSEVDADRLLNAVKAALEWHPLFKTALRYNKGFYLETNNQPLVITHSSAEKRPKQFGASTNDYPWRICYNSCTIFFEWCHAVTDGHGAIRFLGDILNAYFDVLSGDVPDDFPLETGFEHFFDKSVKPFAQVKQAKGFRTSALPNIKNGFRCTSHILTIETVQLLAFSKKSDSTPAAILAPLLSKAIRSRIPESEKNRNVSCGIVVDCRKPTNFKTMHNFILNKVITYTDRMDKMDFMTVCTVYRSILDLFTQKENIIAACTDMIRQTDFLYRLRPRWLQKPIVKLIAKIAKNSMNNIGLTYLGRVPFSETVRENLASLGFRSWPDIGNCVAAVIDLNGTLYIDICENYIDKEVIPAFIKICAECGITANKIRTEDFEQASMIF